MLFSARIIIWKRAFDRIYVNGQQRKNGQQLVKTWVMATLGVDGSYVVRCHI
jgi:hypothetical protein